MYSSILLVLGACSRALAAPTWADTLPRSTSTIQARDSGDKVSVPGIIIAVLFGVAVVGGLALYLLSANGFIARRGWFQRFRDRKKNKGQQSANKELLNPFDDDQEALTKRASFQSERESIMFNRSRSSSLQFAVVEDTDGSRRSVSQQVYILRNNVYVPVERVDTVDVQQEATAIKSGASERAVPITPVDHDASLHTSIPVIITPPLETDQQSRSFEDSVIAASGGSHEARRGETTPLTNS